MVLFDHPDYDKFFNPLFCKNKRIYYECILQLIEKSKQVTLLYENDAKDTLILYFRNLTYAVEEEENSTEMEESISNRLSETENASAVLRYFRRCGWISERELGRNGDNIAAVMPYCRKMINAIERIFNRDASAALTNHIFSIYDILHSAFQAEHGRNLRPYSNILVPVADSVADLKDELLLLKDSIRSIMRIVIKMTETNHLGQFLIRDELMKTFFNDYFFIKKDGLIPGYIDEIEKMLRMLMQTRVYEKMIEEYMALRHVSEEEAAIIIENQFLQIRNFISYDYVKEMDYIDRKINNYYNLYATRVMMVLSNHVNMQTYLNRLLMTLKDFEKEDRREALLMLSHSFRLQSYQYVGRKSIERRKKRRPSVKTATIIESTLTDDERARLTNELLYEQPDHYGVTSASHYFDNRMGNAEHFEPDRENLRTKEDALMVASSIIYSGSSEFPFEVEFLEGNVETDVATISHIRVKRKKHE